MPCWQRSVLAASAYAQQPRRRSVTALNNLGYPRGERGATPVSGF